jgi:DNA adenine methylase
LENNRNIINDIDKDLINFYKHVKFNSFELSEILHTIKNQIDTISNSEKLLEISIKDAKEKRGEFYYNWRNKDRNNGLLKLSELEKAFRFYFVNQWSFNGMRRFNSKGEFNIPYGNYKSISQGFLDKHVNLLNNTELYSTDYKEIILENDNNNVFIFLDPPYTREFKEYSYGNIFGNEDQVELSNVLKSLKNAKFMMIINKDDFTSSLYEDLIVSEYDVKYSTNIKNRFENSVKHLIITNY